MVNSCVTQRLQKYLQNSDQLSLLLDYDGTLSPISPRPDLAIMPPETKKLLQQLILLPNVFVVIISGRKLEDVKSKVGINDITYVGNHGFEIDFPNKPKYIHNVPAEIQTRLNKLKNELNEKLANNEAWVEDKHYSLTFHFRNTPDSLKEEYESKALEIMNSYGFVITTAHCALEAKPPINCNKGTAAILILENNFGEDWWKKVEVIFMGDDTTDEDAMRALKGKGKSFRISSNPAIETAADFVIPSTNDVVDILKWLQEYWSSKQGKDSVNKN